MEHLSLGEIIRALRKRAGISQEELADGICSTVSVSRIENGIQMPSETVLHQLLERLGTTTYRLCDIYYKNEKQLAFERNAKIVIQLLAVGKIEAAKEKMAILEKTSHQDMLCQQYSLLLQAAIELYDDSRPEDILTKLLDAFALTKPQFDFTDFHLCLLSIQEANILNVMVGVYYKMNHTLEAIHLGEELFKALENHNSELSEYLVLKINLALNLASLMEKDQRYQDQMMYAEMAEKLSRDGTEQFLLPEIEYMKAKAWHALGDTQECLKILKAIIPYMELIGKDSFASLAREYAQTELGTAL